MAGSAYDCFAEASRQAEKGLTYLAEEGVPEEQREVIQDTADQLKQIASALATSGQAAEQASPKEKAPPAKAAPEEGARTSFASAARGLSKEVQRKKQAQPY
jgi:hypothetical protein